jgi:flagellin
MPQTINTNTISLNAQRNLSTSQGALSTAMQRLSSGLRVNSAKDDAAGLAIAERMNTQVRGMNVAVRNANDGISLAQTAEGALGRIGDSLQRMRELAVQSANGTNTAEDRANLQAEFLALNSEIERSVGAAAFNNKPLLNLDDNDFVFQVGPNNDDTDKVTIPMSNLKTAVVDIMLTQTIDGETSDASLAAIDALDAAIGVVTTTRASFGAAQNRFESVISNLQVSSENLAAARGRIMDADFAKETAELSRTQILQQAGTAMVSQANQLPQQVLQLLKG